MHASDPRGFFAHHGLWAPGIRLFRQMRFRTKAAVISVLLLLPTLLLGYVHLTRLSEDIAFTEAEITGVQAMRSFTPILLNLLEARNATRATLGGHPAQADLDAARQRVDAGLTAFETHLKSTGDPLGLAAHLATLQTAWQGARQSATGVDANGRTVFGPATEAAVKLLQAISDQSNLVLDPELDSFYTINALFLAMPKAAEDLGQIWGWGTYAVAKGGLDNPEQYRRVAVWSARTAGGIEDSRTYLQRAFAVNPDLAAKVDLKGLDIALKFQAQADPTEMIKAALTPDEVYKTGQQAVRAYFSVFDGSLPALRDLLTARLDRMTTARAALAAVAAVCVLLAAYCFISFARVMDGGLQQVARYLDAMADGELDRAPEPWGRDEAAHLLKSLARMQEAVRHIVLDVRGASHAIVDATGEISQGSMDLSSRTEQAAARLQQTVASLDQITAVLTQTTNGMHEATTLAGDNARQAREGGEVIERARAAMDRIDQASGRIREIIGTIDGLAFQTNLLALNAAVEAARAGDLGRGFGVVAGEVRALAQRSADAAREIRALIADTVESAEAGTQVVGQASTAMKAMLSQTQHLDGVLRDVAASAQRQKADIDVIGATVVHLDEATQRNAALVEQTAAAAAALDDRAKVLVGTVSRFRTGEADADTELRSTVAA